MTSSLIGPFLIAFDGDQLIARGPAPEVALALRAAELAAGGATDAPRGPVLVFEAATGRQIDLDLTGSLAEVAARHALPAAEAERGRGRPKLGVVAREVTLLPRHWDWLNAQPGGASVALRKLVDAARKAGGFAEVERRAQEATNRFLTAMAGDRPGYEAATRALFSGDRDTFDRLTEAWPADIAGLAREMARGAFVEEAPGAAG